MSNLALKLVCMINLFIICYLLIIFFDSRAALSVSRSQTIRALEIARINLNTALSFAEVAEGWKKLYRNTEEGKQQVKKLSEPPAFNTMSGIPTERNLLYWSNGDLMSK